jgi:uncharacterized repeat protein (TIGR01451 family)
MQQEYKQMTSKLKLLVATSIVPAVIMGTNAAHATGTLVGTDINNSVTVDFSVGGVLQTQATASNVFDVDRKVIFTVAEKTPIGTTSIAPSQQNAIVTYLVTNSSNDTLDFDLTAANMSGGSAPRGTDNIDALNLEICVDADENGSCSGTGAETWGTTATINDLSGDTPNNTRTVFVRGDFASTVTNGQIAGVRLSATAKLGDGSTIIAATDATANTSGIETIFADVVGTNDNTAARDGIVSTLDDYTVSAAALSVTKLSRVVRDNLNGANTSADATNPKAVPGATVEYCIVVSNASTASSSATGVAVSDSLAAETNVTYDSTFQAVFDGTLVTGNVCTPGTSNASYTGGTNGTVSATLSDIAPGQTRTLVFRVTID